MSRFRGDPVEFVPEYESRPLREIGPVDINRVFVDVRDKDAITI